MYKYTYMDVCICFKVNILHTPVFLTTNDPRRPSLTPQPQIAPVKGKPFYLSRPLLPTTTNVLLH